MRKIISTVTSKGQVTIPVEVRRYPGLKTNDKVAFVISADGTVQLQAPRYPNIASLRGAAGSLERPMTWKQMKETAYKDRFKVQDDETE
ncbi:MAG TPA: type II toxin-antitoxin system PrlF family antitoxin [Ktedonobacteraceae bacterium]|nr:type II toxin-antitoxin system PrlF family antitoxin [Ktedonobacteraceae bacterium]